MQEGIITLNDSPPAPLPKKVEKEGYFSGATCEMDDEPRVVERRGGAWRRAAARGWLNESKAGLKIVKPTACSGLEKHLQTRNGLLCLTQLNRGHVGEAALIHDARCLGEELEHGVLLQECGAGHVHVESQHSIPSTEALAVSRPNLHSLQKWVGNGQH
jgi:hypothetical protein